MDVINRSYFERPTATAPRMARSSAPLEQPFREESATPNLSASSTLVDRPWAGLDT